MKKSKPEEPLDIFYVEVRVIRRYGAEEFGCAKRVTLAQMDCAFAPSRLHILNNMYEGARGEVEADVILKRGQLE